jgi:hypothetical protein
MLDLLSFCALEGSSDFEMISNAEYLAMLRRRLWPRLSVDKRELFEKLLAKDRCRQVLRRNLEELIDQNFEERYRAYAAAGTMERGLYHSHEIETLDNLARMAT